MPDGKAGGLIDEEILAETADMDDELGAYIAGLTGNVSTTTPASTSRTGMGSPKSLASTPTARAASRLTHDPSKQQAEATRSAFAPATTTVVSSLLAGNASPSSHGLSGVELRSQSETVLRSKGSMHSGGSSSSSSLGDV